MGGIIRGKMSPGGMSRYRTTARCRRLRGWPSIQRRLCRLRNRTARNCYWCWSDQMMSMTSCQRRWRPNTASQHN